MLGKIFRKPYFFSLEISGPKVVENFHSTRQSGPLLEPRPWGFSLTSLMDDLALVQIWHRGWSCYRTSRSKVKGHNMYTRDKSLQNQESDGRLSWPSWLTHSETTSVWKYEDPLRW